MNNNYPYISGTNSYQRHSRVGNFQSVLEDVCEQINIECFPASEQKIAMAIAKIIAEVLILPPTSEISINGDKLSAELVQEMYRALEFENVSDVIDEFSKIYHRITYIKSYLRTALYNSALEFDCKLENLINSRW